MTYNLHGIKQDMQWLSTISRESPLMLDAWQLCWNNERDKAMAKCKRWSEILL